MSDLEFMDGVTDGEEVAAVEPVPEPETPAETTPPEPEAEVEVEQTPEQIEEHKRLSGSARQKAKAERLAEENRQLQERLARLEAKVSPQEPAAQPDGKPSADQFETHAEWVEALTDWKADQRDKAREAKEAQTKAMSAWEEKKAKARETIPDLDDVLSDLVEPPSGVATAVMNASPHTALIAVHLAQHPDELLALNRTTDPAQVALRVAEIALKVSAPKPTPKRTTQAPPPISPVAPSASAVAPSKYDRYEEF